MSSHTPPPPTLPDSSSCPTASTPNHDIAMSPTTPLHGDGAHRLASTDPAHHVSSPSARTSCTHIDSKTEDEVVTQTSTIPYDSRTAPDPTPSLSPPQEQLTESQDPLEPRGFITASVPPSMTTPTQSEVPPVGLTKAVNVSASGTVESVSSQKASTQVNQQPHQEAVPRTPQTFLTLLLVSGMRKTMSFEPETAIGRVKELIWNAWPSEWQEEQPPAPSYLRVLYLGKMLLDDDTLAKLRIPSSMPNAPHHTIVHLSIRPSNCPAEDGAIKKRRKNSDAPHESDGMNRSSCCGCIIC
ncbi:hypothetical protein AGABI1DRAFT_115586 [Agaricus bisporus var. burnettii JB137-S8]|uniref:Ubiquitin-like domain-containing protein n=1 Tax=Agaricus bisporus var. burnettii (strain JB137-S8 / ATCC MYA-4627 / FGSC 10392) TaxID=597362 RepID=K5X1E3_AGABU|nr:uncharacterized protein AGABI1DRAFT_115586 [Agaricus bisporus var. burnettii JB137-S8]EKM76958.1 hypothetical protein AGABI1DRAFT_115586 [Agaricus bisporus var. burnettii JB137-S8]